MVRRAIRVSFLIFLGVGLVLMLADELYKRMNREDFMYLDLTILTEDGELHYTLRDKGRIERVREFMYSMADGGRVVWFGAPELGECVLEMWDNWEESFYRLCRGRDSRWYFQFPGSSGGRKTENYYEVEEVEVKRLIERLRAVLN